MSISTVRARGFVLVKQWLENVVSTLLLAPQQRPDRTAAHAAAAPPARKWRDMPCIAPKGVVFGAVGIHHAKNADPATMSAAGSVFA